MVETSICYNNTLINHQLFAHSLNVKQPCIPVDRTPSGVITLGQSEPGSI